MKNFLHTVTKYGIMLSFLYFVAGFIIVAFIGDSNTNLSPAITKIMMSIVAGAIYSPIIMILSLVLFFVTKTPVENISNYSDPANQSAGRQKVVKIAQSVSKWSAISAMALMLLAALVGFVVPQMLYIGLLVGPFAMALLLLSLVSFGVKLGLSK